MNDLQRTREWYLSRKGKITASEVANILKSGRSKKDVFGQTALSYLDAKIAEKCMSDDDFIAFTSDKPSSAAMDWGTYYEDSARLAYEQATGHSVNDMPFIGMQGFEDYVGGSPDGRLGDDLAGIVEFKCPYNPTVQITHCKYQTPEDLKADNLQYYAQCQLNIICTGADYCDFVSYSPVYKGPLMLKVLRLPRDEEFIALLTDRITLAVDYIKSQLEMLAPSKE